MIPFRGDQRPVPLILDIVRDVMRELGAGPRQMVRVCGLTYAVVYKMWKDLQAIDVPLIDVPQPDEKTEVALTPESLPLSK